MPPHLVDCAGCWFRKRAGCGAGGGMSVTPQRATTTFRKQQLLQASALQKSLFGLTLTWKEFLGNNSSMIMFNSGESHHAKYHSLLYFFYAFSCLTQNR